MSNRVKEIMVWIGIGIILIIVLFPIFMLFLTSLKTRGDALSYPPRLIFTPTLENYREIFDLYPFRQYMFNSFIVALGSTVVALVLGSTAAYALSRYRFKGREQISFWILSLRMMPPVVGAIPIFIIMRQLGLLNTVWSLVFAYTTFNIPFAVWLLVSFFKEIPEEIEESAMVDGCSRFTTFIKITLPLASPGLAATAIFTFIFSWNEFLFALIMTGSGSETLPVAITKFIRETGIMWSHMAAAGMVVMVPMIIFILIVQRYLVRGLTMGAFK